MYTWKKTWSAEAPEVSVVLASIQGWISSGGWSVDCGKICENTMAMIMKTAGKIASATKLILLRFRICR